MNRLLRIPALLAFAALLCATGPAEEVLIDFDDAHAPCSFAEASPLTDHYAWAGVSFSGGMEVLDQCGNFGIVEHSGGGFLAWNTTVQSAGPTETATFASPVANVQFLTGSAMPGTVTATAYDASGEVLATHSVSLVASAIPVVLRAQNISRVVIETTAEFGAIDNFRFEVGGSQNRATEEAATGSSR